MTHSCRHIRYWLKRWAHGKRDESLRRFRQRLGILPLKEAYLQVLACVKNSDDPDIIETTPLLLREVHNWHRKVPNRTHHRVWYSLRRFISRRLKHHCVKVREAALHAVDNAFCYSTADKRRLFLQSILHPQPQVWLTIVDWAEYVLWRDLVSLLLRETAWRSGTAWNVLFALDIAVIDRMDEEQREGLLGALKEVLFYVDQLCVRREVEETALWKICETLGFHIRGDAAKTILEQVAKECRSWAVRAQCLSAILDYWEADAW
jgi:hypothetical protein